MRMNGPLMKIHNVSNEIGSQGNLEDSDSIPSKIIINKIIYSNFTLCLRYAYFKGIAQISFQAELHSSIQSSTPIYIYKCQLQLAGQTAGSTELFFEGTRRFVKIPRATPALQLLLIIYMRLKQWKIIIDIFQTKIVQECHCCELNMSLLKCIRFHAIIMIIYQRNSI